MLSPQLNSVHDTEGGRILFSWGQWNNCPETVAIWAQHGQNDSRLNPELFVDFFCLLFSASVELGPPTKGQAHTKGDREQGGERNIWIDNGGSNRRRGKAA